jgi:hypothetical protein
LKLFRSSCVGSPDVRRNFRRPAVTRALTASGDSSADSGRESRRGSGRAVLTARLYPFTTAGPVFSPTFFHHVGLSPPTRTRSHHPCAVPTRAAGSSSLPTRPAAPRPGVGTPIAVAGCPRLFPRDPRCPLLLFVTCWILPSPVFYSSPSASWLFWWCISCGSARSWCPCCGLLPHSLLPLCSRYYPSALTFMSMYLEICFYSSSPSPLLSSLCVDECL